MKLGISLAFVMATILALGACEPVPYQPDMQECTNVVTGETVRFDRKQAKSSPLIYRRFVFTDQDGYERIVTMNDIGDWKCKDL